MSINIYDLMAELAAGQQARERIPTLESESYNLKTQLNKALDHNQALELRAREREDLIQQQKDVIAGTCKERDEAQFKVMEVEETLTSFRKAVRGFTASILGLGESMVNAEAALDPKKVAEQVSVQASPTVQSITNASSEPAPSTSVASEGAVSSSGATHSTQGQSEARPMSDASQASTGQLLTEPAAASSTPTPPPIASTTSAEPMTDVSTGQSRETETTTALVPMNEEEAHHRHIGNNWKDTNGNWHDGRIVLAQA